MVHASEFPFPQDEVRAAIVECWDLATAEAKPPPTAEKPGSIMDSGIEIDSHGVARCFAAIDKRTDIDIPEAEAKDTEYTSLDDLLANLIPLAQKYFEQQKDKIRKRRQADADSGT